jgi:hypothetical protein
LYAGRSPRGESVGRTIFKVLEMNQPLRTVGVLAVVAATGMIAGRSTGQTQRNDVVTTRALSIVDADGKERAFLGIGRSNSTSPEFIMTDAAGMPRVRIDLAPEDGVPSAFFFDANGKVGISLSLVEERGPRVSLGVDGNGGLMTLGVRRSGGKAAGQLTIRDSEGRELFTSPPAK